MATKLFYLQNSLVNAWCAISETPPGTAASTSTGWTVANTINTNRQPMFSASKVVGGFTSATQPIAPIDTTNHDCWRSDVALTGTFAATAWTITGTVRAVTNATGQLGRAIYRIYRSSDPTGATGVTEITTAEVQGGITGTISTSADATTAGTFTPAAPITFTNEYLFIQIAWLRTTVASMSTADVVFQYGTTTGSRVLTSDFVAGLAGHGSIVGSSGAKLGGVATKRRGGVKVAASGIKAGGTATVARKRKGQVVGASGARVSGAAALAPRRKGLIVGSSGIRTGGTAARAGHRRVTGSSGARLGGVAAPAAHRRVIGASGALVSGVAQTHAGTGAIVVSGAAAITLAPMTTLAAGAVLVSGTSVATLGALTSVATGTARISAASASTLGALTSTGAGTALVHGVATPVLADVVVSAAGVSPLHGWVAVTLDPLGAASAAKSLISAAAAVTLAPLTGTGQGIVRSGGAVNQVLADLGLTATGTVRVTGVVILPTTLPNPQQGVPYAQLLTASGGSGGPFTFAIVAGALPPGLNLAPNGPITGSPTVGSMLSPSSWPPGLVDVRYGLQLGVTTTGAPSYTFTVRATGAGGLFGEQDYTLVLSGDWTGATYSVVNGTLPKCVSLAKTGLAAGPPMQVATSIFTVRVVNDAGLTASQAYSFVVTS